MKKLDFSCPERCINDIIEEGDTLVDMLNANSVEMVERELAYNALFGAKSIKIRTEGKVTEGFVAAALDSDTELVELKRKLETAKNAVSNIRAKIDNHRDTRRMFTMWLSAQRSANLDV